MSSTGQKSSLKLLFYGRKIETMCHYRIDQDLMKFFKKIYEELKCHSANYETALEGTLGDYENTGGFITMDDINDKVKKDI